MDEEYLRLAAQYINQLGIEGLLKAGIYFWQNELRRIDEKYCLRVSGDSEGEKYYTAKLDLCDLEITRYDPIRMIITAKKRKQCSQ